MPSFRQVFFKLAKLSRQRRPAVLRVPPLILRFLTYSRISDSEALLCNGTSGRRSWALSPGALGALSAYPARVALAGREPLAVAGEGERRHPVLVAAQGPPARARNRVPEHDGLVLAARGQHIATRRERHRQDRRLMPLPPR